jgi:G:T/U-mismatch repair DNA glycosylase
MLVKHKFLDKYLMVGKKIVIIGTFNPDVKENKAEFFYGRSKNYFWNLLPKVFGYEPLKEKSVEEKIKFLNDNGIELTDLIYEADIDENKTDNYSDENLKNVVKWNTENIINTLKKGHTEEVYFTRKTFNKIGNIKKEIEKIKKFCEENGIKFRFLPTPARFESNEKLKEWKEKFKN